MDLKRTSKRSKAKQERESMKNISEEKENIAKKYGASQYFGQNDSERRASLLKTLVREYSLTSKHFCIIIRIPDTKMK